MLYNSCQMRAHTFVCIVGVYIMLHPMIAAMAK